MASRVKNVFHTKREQGVSFCKRISRTMIKLHIIMKN